MPHFDNQEDTAFWMETTVDEMNADHDLFHEWLCRELNVPSQSLLCRDGEPYDEQLARYEEDAVLHFQRWYYQLIKKDKFA